MQPQVHENDKLSWGLRIQPDNNSDVNEAITVKKNAKANIIATFFEVYSSSTLKVRSMIWLNEKTRTDKKKRMSCSKVYYNYSYGK